MYNNHDTSFTRIGGSVKGRLCSYCSHFQMHAIFKRSAKWSQFNTKYFDLQHVKRLFYAALLMFLYDKIYTRG